MNTQNLEKALEEIGVFLNLIDGSCPVPCGESTPGMLLSNVDNGTTALSAAETERFRRARDKLVNSVSEVEHISVRAVTELLHQAIWTTLDLRGKLASEDKVFESRRVRQKKAVEDLREALKAPPRNYYVYHVVNSLSPGGLPITFGRVEFSRFGPAQTQRFRTAAENRKVSVEEIDKGLRAVNDLERALEGCIVAGFEVKALEYSAAEAKALKEIRLTVDVINFFTDLASFNSAHLSLPDDSQGTHKIVPQIEMRDGALVAFMVNEKVVGQMGELPLAKLLSADSDVGSGLHRASRLLASSRNNLEDQLVDCMQWAGRASTERRAEQAFLFFMIALESLILPAGTPKGQRLGGRVAYLLYGNESSAKAISEYIRSSLYDVRSRIVHDGRFRVTAAELGEVRKYAKECIWRIANTDTFMKMSELEELNQWFQDNGVK